MKAIKKIWDSDFFGVQVGQIELLGDGATGELLELEQGEFECIYVYSETRDHLSEFQLAGYCSEGIYELLTFEKILNEDGITHSACEYLSQDDQPLRELSRLAGHSSRFKQDPCFCGRYGELYDAWIQNSVRGDLADKVMVSSNGANYIGLATIKFHKDYSQIGLLAVDSSSRGKGIAADLLQAVESCSLGAGLGRIRVATQGDNLGAVNCYLKNGYSLFERRYVSHFWRVKA